MSLQSVISFIAQASRLLVSAQLFDRNGNLNLESIKYLLPNPWRTELKLEVGLRISTKLTNSQN